MTTPIAAALTANDGMTPPASSSARRTARRPRPQVTSDVYLTVDGPAMLVADNPFAFGHTGAAGALWLRTRLTPPAPSP